MKRRWSSLVLMVVACSPAARTAVAPLPQLPQSAPSPALPPAPPSGPAATVAPVARPQRSTAPEMAASIGMMPLKASGIPRFAQAHPEFDGRGVLIAILDSGIDPSIPGLQLTTNGQSKILDLRDFSGEGRIALQPVVRRGDTLIVNGHAMLGAGRVAAMADGAAIWGGTLDELRLGEAPAADINGNGTVGDSLPLVVVHGGSGWIVFADANGDGSFANDRPVRDYAVAREAFGWTSTNLPAPVSIAVNLSDSAGVPGLDLFFDTSSHGSHVSGIAAGHDLYDVKGFDGVAPGARLLGLKIANDAQGAVTVSGSMLRALRYAIAFARERRLPLVVNLSFGVGNEVEGRAAIDARFDSILAANRDVVMLVAAGNDGPGLSTVGFPGSAFRVLSIGATDPGNFEGFEPRESGSDPVADFSSRGGELAAPDLVVPGIAYSTVPNFAIGGEQESGTSMATPYASGLAARLLSSLPAARRPIDATMIAQALRNASTLPPAATVSDAGAGTPDLTRAWEWLAQARDLPDLAIEVGALQARGAVWLTTSAEASARELSTRVIVKRRDGTGPLLLQLTPTEPWVKVPPTLALQNGRGEFTVRVDAASVKPGVQFAAVQLGIRDSSYGILARVPVVVRVPLPAIARVVSQPLRVAAGGVARVLIPADTGRGMQIEVETLQGDAQVTASLHEPGGMPFRDGAAIPAGSGDGAALFDLSASDVESGLYEVAVTSGRLAPSAATVTVRRAPARLEASRTGDSLRVTARSLIGSSVSLRLRAGLVGAEQSILVRRTTAAPVRLAVKVPSWATRVQVDARMPRAEWDRFTDFGFTFQDRSGRKIASAPINYAFARAAPELPARLAGDTLVLLLAPAFAVTDSTTWQLDLKVRFYAERVIGLDDGGRAAQALAPGRTLEQRFHTGPLPLELPAGFTPVILVLAQEGEDTIWTREIALQGGIPK
ncbi:MAG: S8 family serine peptidase [Gemmatimonadales bacterium]